MRTILTVFLIIGIALAVPLPGRQRLNNENDIEYSWDGFTYELEALNIGFVAITESVNGADSVAVWFDVNTSTYDFWDVYVTAMITGDATDEDMKASLRWYDNATVPVRTAADTLNFTGFNSGDTDFGTLYYTVETDSAGRANSKLITQLVPGVIYSCPVPFRCDETTSATDSIGYFFEVITNDSCEVGITLIAIPRT